MLIALLFGCFAATTTAAGIVKTTDVPTQFTHVKPADPQHIVPFYLAVQQQNLDLLQKQLLELSDPSSRHYGQWMTQEQVTALTSRPQSTQYVLQWLHDHQFQDIQPTLTGDVVFARGTNAQMSTHFATQMSHYQHRDNTNTNQTCVQTHTYQLPEALNHHITFVGQISSFVTPELYKTTSIWSSSQPRPKPQPHHHQGHHQSPTQPLDLKGNTTIDVINQVYNVTSNRVRPHGGATQGLLAIGQAYNTTDLITFANRFHIPKPLSNITTSAASKASNFPFECTHAPNACLEASLDQETICGVAQGAATTFWNADPNSQMWFTEYMIYLVNANDGVAPLINSFSYDILEKTWSGDLKDHFSVSAIKLGARGITILTASGDDGVAGYSTRSHGEPQCGYHPAFPASNPWVLTIGATVGPEAHQPEVACTFATGGLISSGGGFSNWYPRPAYQENAVQQYLSNSSGTVPIPDATGYNISSRAYPDISALGHNFPTSVGGTFYLVSGTSGSTPLMAGLFTLINEQRLLAGKSSVGFVNPALYALHNSSAHIFNDIVAGKNNCCAAVSDPVCCPQGFEAVPGFDPVTGLGSINHGLLLEAFMNM